MHADLPRFLYQKTEKMTGPSILSGNDASTLDRFLMARPESSLILLANSRSAGLVDRGEVFQGTYAAFQERGEITGVAAHYWNGMVFIQAPQDPFLLVSAALAASGRECTGIAGPYEQVQEVLPGFLKTRIRPSLNSRDTLLSLDLDALVIPDLLKEGAVTCRLPSDQEVPALITMRIAFMQEHFGRTLSPAMEKEAHELVSWQQQTGNHRVLEFRGSLVATAAVTTGSSGMVQVGGVYTLPEFRNRGFGRAVVAGSLLSLRERGIRKAILFTGKDMPAAQRMYWALGFRPIGEYGLVIFQS
jgi:ribosomal protein S18 acetylase RimI-like enzyme